MSIAQAEQTTPQLLGRISGEPPEEADPRAVTVKAAEATVPYASVVLGSARVELFRSVDDEDRGGVVLRLTTDDGGGSSFAPMCRFLRRGLELHLAGDSEAEAMLRALNQVIATAIAQR